MRIPPAVTAVIVAGLIVGLAGCASRTAAPGMSATVATPDVTESATSSSSASPTPTTTATPTPTVAAVDVALVSYGSDGATVYASGIVPQLTDDAGTCTLTATNGAAEHSASIAAAAAATSVNCGRIRIDVEPGTWTLTLSYASASHAGRSAPTTVTVQ